MTHVANPIPDTPQTVAALVEWRATTHPDIEALVDSSQTLTFAELAAQTASVAAGLRANGFNYGDRVAVSGPNSVDLIMGFLAAMRLGLVWVGISRAYTDRERNELMADCDARPFAVAATPFEAQDAWPEIDPFAPAVIAYTSGTTGVPKGVVHSQRNLVLPAVVARHRGDGGGRNGVYLPLTSVNMQCLGPISSLVNATTCIAIDVTKSSEVAAAIEKFGVERIAVSAATVIDFVTDDRITRSQLATLTDLIVGGSATPEWLFDAYTHKFGQCLVAGYGLTEGPTSITRTDPSRPRHPGSAGAALPHLVIDICNEGGAAVPPGTVGEICVRTATDGPFADVYTPMLSYWNRSQASAETLRNGRIHTGDIGWLDDHNELHIEDRRVDLIVRGGTNVYPAEVERILDADPRILASAVVGRADVRLGQVPIAFVSAQPGAVLTKDDVLEICQGNLAKFKWPVEVRFVDQLPRNAMGKILRTELRKQLDQETHDGSQ